MMKIYSQLLALCVLTVSTNAFVSPQQRPAVSLRLNMEQQTSEQTSVEEVQLQREIEDLRAQVGNLKDMRTELKNNPPSQPMFGQREPMREMRQQVQQGAAVFGQREPIRDHRPQAPPTREGAVTVQGGSLKTWAFTTTAIDRVKLVLETEGRPLDAHVELWSGPSNAPQQMSVYNEDGSYRPFSCVIETPRGQNSVAVRNTAMLEFPLKASLEAEVGDGPLAEEMTSLARTSYGAKTIQGGALTTYPFEPQVSSVGVLLQTEGRPLNARIELMQGPSNTKQVVDIYSEDGLDRPFYSVIETPGPTGTVVRVINTSSMEFPIRATVEPCTIEEFVGRESGVRDFFRMT